MEEKGQRRERERKRGKRTVIRSYEQLVQMEIAHPVFGYKVSYRTSLGGSGPAPVQGHLR